MHFFSRMRFPPLRVWWCHAYSIVDDYKAITKNTVFRDDQTSAPDGNLTDEKCYENTIKGTHVVCNQRTRPLLTSQAPCRFEYGENHRLCGAPLTRVSETLNTNLSRRSPTNGFSRTRQRTRSRTPTTVVFVPTPYVRFPLLVFSPLAFGRYPTKSTRDQRSDAV